MTVTQYFDAKPMRHRAQCIRVLDVNLIECLIERGFDEYKVVRLQLCDVEPCADELHAGARERNRATECMRWLKELLQPSMVQDAALLVDWPVLVDIHPAKLPRSVPRHTPETTIVYIADVYVKNPDDLLKDLHINEHFNQLGIAKQVFSSPV